MHDERIAIGSDRWHTRLFDDPLDPVREDKATLEQRRRTMTSQTFSAQLQQDPVPENGEMVKWSWFRRDEANLSYEEDDRYVQRWDTAFKAGELNDYSACTTWLIKGRDYYLLDVWRVRVTFPELKREVYAQAAKWGIDVLLSEDKIGQTTHRLTCGRRRSKAASPDCSPSEEDKVIRMAAQTDRIEQGQVHLPLHAAWLATFRFEILQFPNGRHDDQVDSLSQFLQRAT